MMLGQMIWANWGSMEWMTFLGLLFAFIVAVPSIGLALRWMFMTARHTGQTVVLLGAYPEVVKQVVTNTTDIAGHDVRIAGLETVTGELGTDLAVVKTHVSNLDHTVSVILKAADPTRETIREGKV